VVRRRASDVSDGWHEGAVCVGKCEVQDKTATFESVNEIHAFGLYDKRRTRHRGGKPGSRSFPMRKGMRSFAGCESLKEESNANLGSRL
jgi:hypothetical protein